jgi:peroxiredoxin
VSGVTDDIHRLPPDLPVPVDDGACDHLTGSSVPPIALESTRGGRVTLSALPGRIVVYCYPRTGEDGLDPPPGWNEIAGARGCTPQTCGFRDLNGAFARIGATVFGMSTQTSEYQREMVARLHVPFEVLSDEHLEMVEALSLPTFDFNGMRLIKRITLFLRDGVVEHLIYPVFPPDRSAAEAVRWLEGLSTSN